MKRAKAHFVLVATSYVYAWQIGFFIIRPVKEHHLNYDYGVYQQGFI